ncbi:MAG: TRAP transporter substrate-binding protein [Alphaproteobacteria bacterium]
MVSRLSVSAVAGLSLGLLVQGAAAQEVSLVYATVAGPGTHANRILYHPWAEKINRDGKGVVRLEIKDGFALANHGNVYGRVQDDVVQVAFMLQNAGGKQFQRSAVGGLPFFADDPTNASTALWQTYASGVLEPEYRDIVPLVLIVFPQSGVHTAKPLASPADVKGLKLVVLGALQSRVATQLGAVPISIPISNMYEAIQRGTADGAIASWTTFNPFKLGEVTSYHVEASLGTSTAMLFMSKKRFAALPEAAQKVLLANAGEQMSKKFGAYFAEEMSETRDKVKATAGNAVVELTAEQREAWRQLGKPVIDDFKTSVPNGEKIVAQFESDLARLRDGK